MKVKVDKKTDKTMYPITISNTFIPRVFAIRETKLDQEPQKHAEIVSIPTSNWKRNDFIKKWSESSQRLAKNGKFTFLLIPLAACGGRSNDEDNTETISGFVFDGYLKNATVFLDLNKDGNLDLPTEPTDTTNTQGYFSIPEEESGYASAPIVALPGGIDVDTGEVFKGTLTAPAGSSAVSPVTTLVLEVMNSGGNGSISKEDAVLHVQSVLSLGGIDLLNLDPFAAAGNESLAKAAVLLGSLMQVGSDDSEADAILAQITSKLVEQVDAGSINIFNLQDNLQSTVWVEDLLSNAIPSISNEGFIAEVYTQKAEVITNAASLEDLSSLQTNSKIVFDNTGVSIGT